MKPAVRYTLFANNSAGILSVGAALLDSVCFYANEPVRAMIAWGREGR